MRETAARLGVPLHGGAALAAPASTSTTTGSGASGAAAAPPPLPPSAVESFLSELTARAADLQRQLAEAKAANRRQDEALTGQVDKANAALGRAAETKRMKQEQQQQLQRTADGIENEVRDPFTVNC